MKVVRTLMKQKASKSGLRIPRQKAFVTTTMTNAAVVRPRARRQAVAALGTLSKFQPSARVTARSTSFGLTSRFAATVLILFFIFVPLADAYADNSTLPIDVELLNVQTSETPVEVVEATPEAAAAEEQVSPSSAEEIPVAEEIAEKTIPEVVPEEIVVPVGETLLDATTTETVADDLSTTTFDVPPSSGDSTLSTSTPPVVLATSTPAVEDLPIATTTPDVVPVVLPIVDVATTAPIVATSTEVVSEITPEVSTHKTDADRFAFSTTECVPLGNGAFHCVRATEQASVGDDRGDLYSARDVGGDLEIYMNNGTSDAPLTDNEYDDDAPSYDSVSGDVVWHSLIDDRYQVVSYERTSGATTRITKESYNSMQPAVFNKDIVFQSWIGNDWDIVLVDDTEGRIVLSENDVHDIAPSINANYIMWQSYENDVWVAKVYDRATKVIETVRGLEGGKVENPRMVMVFDSKKENGDVETIGYDPESGEVAPLATTPAPLPQNIPEPEHQKEEKALIQTVTAIKTETKTASTTGSTPPDPIDSGVDAVATTTAPVIATSTEPIVEEAPTIDMTVVATSSVPVLPDLVIPAFNRSTDEATTTAS